MTAVRALLPDGKRWHFQQGPIDLVIEAWGEAHECARAYEQAWKRFETVLPELVSELAMLRRPIPSLSRASGREGAQARRSAACLGSEGTPFPAAHASIAETPFPHLPSTPQSGVLGPLLSRCAGEERMCPLSGSVARRMWNACAPLAHIFITPMAAVAGAVADEILAAMTRGRRLRKAYVNNGGDIAIHLAPAERFETGIIGDLSKPKITATAGIAAEDGVRGIATSGWRGRSFSLGIADSAMILAPDAAAADAAATLVANAVNTDHPAIQRRPASALDPDSDLGEHLVTVAVGALDAAAITNALDRGEQMARSLRHAGHIAAAYLELCGQQRTIGGGATRAPYKKPQPELAWSLRQ